MAASAVEVIAAATTLSNQLQDVTMTPDVAQMQTIRENLATVNAGLDAGQRRELAVLHTRARTRLSLLQTNTALNAAQQAQVLELQPLVNALSIYGHNEPAVNTGYALVDTLPNIAQDTARYLGAKANENPGIAYTIAGTIGLIAAWKLLKFLGGKVKDVAVGAAETVAGGAKNIFWYGLAAAAGAVGVSMFNSNTASAGGPAGAPGAPPGGPSSGPPSTLDVSTLPDGNLTLGTPYNVKLAGTDVPIKVEANAVVVNNKRYTVIQDLGLVERGVIGTSDLQATPTFTSGKWNSATKELSIDGTFQYQPGNALTLVPTAGMARQTYTHSDKLKLVDLTNLIQQLNAHAGAVGTTVKIGTATYTRA